MTEFENDKEVLREFKLLLEFVTPSTFRKVLSELFCNHLLNLDNLESPEQQRMFSHLYYVLNFVEDLEYRDTESETYEA